LSPASPPPRAALPPLLGSGPAALLRPGSRRGKLAALGGSASSYVSPDSGWAAVPSALASTTARVVAKCLAANHSLQLLDLSESGLDDLAGCFLARALRHNGRRKGVLPFFVLWSAGKLLHSLGVILHNPLVFSGHVLRVRFFLVCLIQLSAVPR
jgi:hypothetical protein